MIASLLSPTSTNSQPQPQPGRISQLLPSVKCSTCHRPVPLDELGDHTCVAPPPVPGLPKPSMTPEAAAALLPGRLQGRVGSPGSVPANSSSPRVQEPPQHQRLPSSSSTTSRLRINTRGGGGSPTQPSFQPKSSPLARSDPDPSSLQSREPFPTSASLSSSSNALRTRMRTPSNAGSVSSMSSQPRMRAPSNAGSMSNQPPARPPPGSFNPNEDVLPPSAPLRKNSNGFPPAPVRSIQGQQRSDSPSISSTSSMNNFPPPNANRGIPGGGFQPGDPYQPGGSYPVRSGTPGGPGPLNNNMINGNGGPRPMGLPYPGGNAGPPPPPPPGRPDLAFVPPAERGIDTKTGGEAGMAGVGRRGFAAAARAAMFVQPSERPMGPQPQGQYGMRRPNAPQYLDIDAASRSASTPPLSAGSGYSSHSPSGPTSPLSQSDFNSNFQTQSKNAAPVKQLQTRTPSPSIPSSATPTQAMTNNSTAAAASPISGRLPLFEKMRGRLPGLGGAPTEPADSPTTAKPILDASRIIDTSFFASGTASSRSKSRSTSRSRDLPQRPDRAPISPIESESEYGGLAYADSTDGEDNADENDFNSRRSNSRRRGSRSPPPSVPPPSASTAAAASTIAMLQRNGSKASSHIQFGSVSTRTRSRSRSNDRGDIRIGGAGPMSVSGKSGSSLSRVGSMVSASAYSDDGEGDGVADLAQRVRSNSSAVARALGLAQTPPSEYAKLGGPGIPSRSGSVRSAAGGPGEMILPSERARGVGLPGGPMKPSASVSSKSSAASSSSLGKQRAIGAGGSMDSGRSGVGALRRLDVAAANNRRTVDDDDDGDSVFGSASGSRAQRSNTVQGLQSPDAAKKPIKLPARALTSPKVEGYKSLSGDGSRSAGAVKKARKPKTCLRCSKAIEDGRWVSVDNGGVLCEKCWKNMYLPKCRRCNLPIEKQAVSSSDGQLKGKYHKECFNCATCQKPFPDKTFYVYDGKPLCAYHYHEANDSLCAAARCGQPIEGPCAVSYSGDRYHPEHMTCEYPGYPDCREQLSEYWEVDGRMLCERHAHTATRNESDGESDERWVQSSKALKRVTRFIDLAGAGGLGAPGVGVGGSGLM